MDELSILVTFAVGLAGALVFGYIALRLRLSPIIGYLLAGIVVGPFTPGDFRRPRDCRAVRRNWCHSASLRHWIAFSFKRADRGVARGHTGRTDSEHTIHVRLGCAAASDGMELVIRIILGMAISVASTVVMALVLAEWNDLHAKIGHIAIGWTVVEDILTVALLLLLPIIFAPDQ